MAQVWNIITEQRQQKIQESESVIRKYFQQFNSPLYYISYKDFCDNFEVHGGKNFKQQNLNIIDTHLKYRQWIYEQMAPYKWTPIILYSIFQLIRLRRPPLIIPFVYTSLFDHYMHPFFIWLHKDDKIINIKYQFASKLSKIKNKQRRVNLFKNLQQSLKQVGLNNVQIPYKYIKFGYPTEYVFHAMNEDQAEMSTVLQTKLFESYMSFRYPNIQSVKDIYTKINNLKNKFLEFKQDPDRKKYFLDLNEFLKFKDIKQSEIYQLSTCIEKRIRRWLEIFMYDRSNKIFYSSFTLDQLLYLYEHKHLSAEPKYNVEQNSADLTIYYSLILIPTLLLKFFKR